MIRTGHVGKVELISLLTIFSGTDVFLSYPQQLVLLAAHSAWMIPLIAAVPALYVFSFIGRIIREFDLESLLSFGQKDLGLKGGGVIGILFVLYFTLASASEMRQFTETVVTTVLPKSPVGYVALPFILVITYFAYMGIEGLTRVAWVAGPWLLLGVALLLVFNLNWARVEYLSPIWGNGVEQTLFHGFWFSGVFTNVLLIGILAPLLREKRQFLQVGTWSILLTAFVYTAFMLMFIMVFSTEVANKMPFPMYQFARMIYMGRFVQRLESAFVFIWVACAVIKIATGLWAASYITANALRMPVFRPLVIPFALIIYSLSFLPRSFPETLHYDVSYILGWSWLIVLVIPALLVLQTKYRRRKRGYRHG